MMMPEDGKSAGIVLEGHMFSTASPSLILRRGFFGTIWTTQVCFVSQGFCWFILKASLLAVDSQGNKIWH